MAISSSSPSSPFPVGYRFRPTEEELVSHYLKKKIHGKDFNDVIAEIDICSCEPWDLPGFSRIRSDDEEWYYFSRPDYKSGKNKGRANRATERGFWKITGREREIKARESKAVIGKKRTLTFYTGKVRSGQKTCWVIHEYYIPETLLPDAARQRDFVLCRLKKKDESTDIGACDEGEPSPNNTSDFQNLVAVTGTRSIPEDLQITLQDDIRPEEILATLFPSLESPQHDYFAAVLREDFLHADPTVEHHYELQCAVSHVVSEDEELVNLVDGGGYSRTTLLNHSSEPKSLRKVYDEGINRQGITSAVATKELQAAGDMLSSRPLVTYQSSLNESRGRKGEMITAESYRRHMKQGFPLQKVKFPSKLPEKPKERPRNDEGKGMKQKQTGTTITDWKSSFIVWKESPLSLGSYPPIAYIRNMIGGLFMFIFFLGELFSYGTWYTS